MKVFNDTDYNSGDGMLTSVWGPSMWHTLHAISFNYPVKPTPEDKQKYLKFFKSIGGILPCRYCRENFKKNIKAVPLTYATMKNFPGGYIIFTKKSTKCSVKIQTFLIQMYAIDMNYLELVVLMIKLEQKRNRNQKKLKKQNKRKKDALNLYTKGKNQSVLLILFPKNNLEDLLL